MKKIILILILALIIIAGAYFLYNAKLDNASANLSTYTHPNGAYSFQYPARLFVNEKDGTAIISQLKDGPPILASVSAIYYPNYVATFEKNPDLKIDNVIKGGYKVAIISHIKQFDYGRQYIISLDESDNPSIFLVAFMRPNTVGFTQEEFDSTFNSLEFDKEKITQLGKELANLANVKAREAKLKASLYSIRPAAELYYEAKTGYAGLCNPVGASQSENLLKNSYKAITDDIGAANISCMAEKLAYAFSIKIPSGIFLCIDSTGYNSTINQQVKGYSCK